MQLVIKELKQLPPITNTTAQVQVSFEIQGALPDLVQIYAGSAAGSDPSDLILVVPMTPPKTDYDVVIQLQAGSFFTITVCPRKGTDPKIEGEYWESYCQWGNIITKAVSQTGGTRPPPDIQTLSPQPATLSQDNRIIVTWSSSTLYNKIIIGWTENGIQMDQGEIDLGNPGKNSGSWTASTTPGAQCTFSADGGVSGGVFGNYNYSGWGPKVNITASQNSTSLKQFLENSGINPFGQTLNSLMPHGVTLREFMKLK